ncbi:UDP-N-acetylglucosamine diphosphorylase [Mycotypha africana]|uniref:UDP-N-acetylglucosamine diphosphorylase n=1 Tax=Mycotypha africana TaxID=64632 RepID=UPI00230182E1|nr:UDP-N-acetylglucosamine diphosphorylase [Mycotypha africana]KAI8988208.1 UDP-N-acetylglucosamine diphosphorylase [Mycotypha africana]
MTVDYQGLRDTFEAAGQGHIFAFFEQLTAAEQEEFLSQLAQIDVEEATKTAKKALEKHGQPEEACAFEPIPEDVIVDVENNRNRDAWFAMGMDLIRKNQVAVILMAGGQGTRLGSPDPKGCYNIGLPSGKSLFQLQAERIRRLQTLAATDGQDAVIPWYIMTSGPTDKPTRDFFTKNNYFGLNPENIIFFQQGVMPCFTHDAKFMLEGKGKLAVAPDGNGGIYGALHKEGVIKSLKERGIRYSHCYCVDNCLARVADPAFIGYCASRNTDCGIKVVPKSHPEEPVGVVARRNGKYGVVEYSEISAELAHMRQENGQLAFGAANIVNHFFSTEFLERVPSFAHELQYHVANKKIPHIDTTTGEFVKPTKPNGIKLERFVFDVFGHSNAFSVLQVSRDDEFSPLKNAPGAGVDCPETSRAAILDQSRRFIQKAGGHFKDDTIEIEVSPLLSYAGENLEAVSGNTIQRSGILTNLEDIALAL